MMNAGVSIIMSVYNEEKFIRQCLDSVINQREKNFELIVVDDGSYDNTLSILQEYARRDSRIKVLCGKRRKGLVIRRNDALEKASGKYVMIVDGDDFLSPDAVSSALEAIDRTGASSCVLDLQMYYGSDKIVPYNISDADLSGTISGEQAFIMGLRGELHGICLEEKSHYDRIPFDCSCSLYSDDNTARIHYYISERICFCRGKYFYRQHPSSETHKISAKRFQFLLADISLRNAMQALGADRLIMREIEIHRWKNTVAHYKLLRFHRSELTSYEVAKAKSIIRAAILSTNFRILPLSLILRPPYWPASGLRSFTLWQELYFLLHRIYRSLITKK